MSICVEAFNPDHGLYSMLKGLFTRGNTFVGKSRNGPVTRFNRPVSLVWAKPMQRVSQDPIRDANPAFHLFEAFWMLNGENDVLRPSHFASGMKNFSDNGTTFEGAYGHRWRKHFGHDQLMNYIIPSLQANRDDRRCVLAMWDGKMDPINGQAGGKDLCCNLSAIFDASMGRLDMTVTNRSNDIVWGACGANVVHFSILQEYVAGVLGMPVGVYTQFSTNSHVYNDFPETKKVMKLFRSMVNGGNLNDSLEGLKAYKGVIIPIFQPGVDSELNKTVIDADIQRLMDDYDKTLFDFESHFFRTVVGPVMRAYNLYKADQLEKAISELEKAVQSDWVIATRNWIDRRCNTRNGKIAELHGTVEEEIWDKTVKAVWPSATKRTISVDGTMMPAYEAEVWNGKQSILENVGMFNQGMVTIRQRGCAT